MQGVCAGCVCRVCVGCVCRDVCAGCVCRGVCAGCVCKVCVQGVCAGCVCSDVCVEERVHAGQLHGLAQTPGLRQACPRALTASSSRGAGACLSLLQSSVCSSHGHSPGHAPPPRLSCRRTARAGPGHHWQAGFLPPHPWPRAFVAGFAAPASFSFDAKPPDEGGSPGSSGRASPGVGWGPCMRASWRRAAAAQRDVPGSLPALTPSCPSGSFSLS